MNRQPVQSSMVKAWAFDPTTDTLEIEFTNGRVYQYEGVPAFLAKGFELATSKGRFFMSRIDRRFRAGEVHQD